MIRRVLQKIHPSTSAKNQDEIIVLILTRKNSVFHLFIKNSLERMEDLISKVEFHFISNEKQEVKILMDNYGLGKLPAILFFTKDGLKRKIEGLISKVEFESILKSLIEENERDINKE